MSKKEHYDFLFHVIPKKKRYSKYIKTRKNETIDLIADYYQVNTEIAKEYAMLLPKEKIKEINSEQNFTDPNLKKSKPKTKS
jgi:hypothetical protein